MRDLEVTVAELLQVFVEESGHTVSNTDKPVAIELPDQWFAALQGYLTRVARWKVEFHHPRGGQEQIILDTEAGEVVFQSQSHKTISWCYHLTKDESISKRSDLQSAAERMWDGA